jgi:hypothetical protein
VGQMLDQMDEFMWHTPREDTSFSKSQSMLSDTEMYSQASSTNVLTSQELSKKASEQRQTDESAWTDREVIEFRYLRPALTKKMAARMSRPTQRYVNPFVSEAALCLLRGWQPKDVDALTTPQRPSNVQDTQSSEIMQISASQSFFDSSQQYSSADTSVPKVKSSSQPVIHDFGSTASQPSIVFSSQQVSSVPIVGQSSQPTTSSTLSRFTPRSLQKAPRGMANVKMRKKPRTSGF